MSTDGHQHHGLRCWSQPMAARDPHEGNRVATPLELLFDLCFVVAIAQAAAHLHHGLGDGHLLTTLLRFAMVFFAIWWAWMNFTWFASAYDTDDVPYRLLTLVQIAGVLVLAAGVPRAFEDGDFTRGVMGYVLMRMGLIAQWLRAACADARGRRTALRYALGILLCQFGWVATLFLPLEARGWCWPALVPLELLVPVWAERVTRTAWHAHHIAERYSLLALIVLGEVVLSATTAIQVALDDGHGSPALVAVIAGGLLLIFAMWWLYFDHPAHHVLRSQRAAFVWGYGHLAIFAAIAAVGAGLGVAVDAAVAHGGGLSGGHGAAGLESAHGGIPAALADAAVAVPVAVFLLGLWLLVVLPARPRRSALIGFPLTALLILASIGSGCGVLASGVLSALLVAVLILTAREPPPPSHHVASH